jgi:hypothetical protein
MKEYYREAIDEGKEMFDDYMQGFDNSLATLDHYSNAMSLLGKEQDYDTMNHILQSRVDILNDKVAATKAFIASYDE